MVKLCILPKTSSGKTQMLLLEKNIYSMNINCNRFIAFTFDLCGLPFVICLSFGARTIYGNYYVNQLSELLTRFQIDFISMEFLLLRCQIVSGGEMSLAMRSKERWQFFGPYNNGLHQLTYRDLPHS